MDHCIFLVRKVGKFRELCATHILREINFGKFKVSKSVLPGNYLDGPGASK